MKSAPWGLACALALWATAASAYFHPLDETLQLACDDPAAGGQLIQLHATAGYPDTRHGHAVLISLPDPAALDDVTLERQLGMNPARVDRLIHPGSSNVAGEGAIGYLADFEEIRIHELTRHAYRGERWEEIGRINRMTGQFRLRAWSGLCQPITESELLVRHQRWWQQVREEAEVRSAKRLF